MHKDLISRFSIIAIGLSFGLTAFSSQENCEGLKIKADDVRLRSLPYLNGKILKLMKIDQDAFWKGDANEWIYIQLSTGERGFVFNSLVEVNKVTNQVMIAGDDVRLRAWPQPFARIIRKMNRNDSGVLADPENQWAFIELSENQRGFVSKKYLDQKHCEALSESQNSQVDSNNFPPRLEGNPANRELVKTISSGRLEIGDFEGAERVLKRHVLEDPTDATTLGTLGDLKLKQGELNEAADLYKKAAEFSGKDIDRAKRLYAAAGALQLGGIPAQSATLIVDISQIKSLSKMLEPQLRRATDYLNRNEPLPPLVLEEEFEAEKTPLRALVGIKGGYDSNVLLLPDSTPAVTTGSFFYSPSFQLEGGIASGAESAKLRSYTSFTGYQADQAKSYNTLFQSLGSEWSPSAFRKSIWAPSTGVKSDFTFVNSSGYKLFSITPSVYLNAVRVLDEDRSFIVELNLGYQHFPNALVSSSEDSRNGVTLTPTILYQTKFNDWLLSNGLNYQESITEGSVFRNRTIGLSSGVSHPLLWEMNGRSGVNYSYVQYQEADPKRRDHRFDFSLGLQRQAPFHSQVTFSLDYLISINQSSIGAANYDRNTVFFQTLYSF